MPAGRPPKYKTPEEMQAVIDDGLIAYEGASINCTAFNKEKDVVTHIESHIGWFCKSVLGDTYKSHEVDQDIRKRNRMAPRGRRVDIVIECKNHTFVIEVKNPKTAIDNRHAIGQILDYGREFPDPKKRLVIITTFFDENTAQTIAHYKLPIKYIYINQSQSYEYIGKYK